MCDDIDAFDGFVKGSIGSDVLHLNELKLVVVLAEKIIEVSSGLIDAAHGTAHRVAVLEELPGDPCSNVAVNSRDENKCRRGNGRH